MTGLRTAGPAANDTLYTELELRYGGGFAQWIVDSLDAITAKESI